MESRTVKLQSDDGRWLEMTVQGDQATACVNGAEPFSFSFENLGYAAHNIGYQAWGAGSHFSVRQEADGVAFEFQGPGERSAARCRLSREEMRNTIDRLDVLARVPSSASML